MLGRKICNGVIAVILYQLAFVIIFGSNLRDGIYRYDYIAGLLWLYCIIEFILYMIFAREKMFIVIWRLLTVACSAALILMWHNQYLMLIISICCYAPIILQVVLDIVRLNVKYDFNDTIEFFLPTIMVISAFCEKDIYYIIFSIVLIVYVTGAVIRALINDFRAKKNKAFLEDEE